jgi:hypothetical protein
MANPSDKLSTASWMRIDSAVAWLPASTAALDACSDFSTASRRRTSRISRNVRTVASNVSSAHVIASVTVRLRQRARVVFLVEDADATRLVAEFSTSTAIRPFLSE